MGVFGRSWHLTKASFSVVNKDKEMLWFPILNAIFSILFMVGILIPFVFGAYIFQTGNAPNWGGDILIYVLIFLVYYGVSVINTFFAMCVVYTAKIRFEGGDATFGESIKYSFSKFGRILEWAFLAAVVGIIIGAIQGAANRAKTPGARIAGKIGAGVASAAWSITTLFVMQVLVFHDMGPFAAIKKSLQTLRKTWGESIIGWIGLGLIQFLITLAGIGIFALLLWMGMSFVNMGLIIGAIIFLLVYIVIVALVFGCATAVYKTALFIYAETGQTPFAYTEDMMANGVKAKEVAYSN